MKQLIPQHQPTALAIVREEALPATFKTRKSFGKESFMTLLQVTAVACLLGYSFIAPGKPGGKVEGESAAGRGEAAFQLAGRLQLLWLPGIAPALYKMSVAPVR